MTRWPVLKSNLFGVSLEIPDEKGNYPEENGYKKTVLNYLNNHPKLEKQKGDTKHYYLKNSVLKSPIITLGQTAMYFADSDWWYLTDKEDKLFKNGMKWHTPSGTGSGDGRLFYQYAIPEVVDALVNRLEKNVEELTKINNDVSLYVKQYKIDQNLKEIKNDF